MSSSNKQRAAYSGQRSVMKSRITLLFLIVTGFGCCSGGPNISASKSQVSNLKLEISRPGRLAAQSPWFWVSEENIALQASYSGFDPAKQQRFSSLTIGDKALDMIADANELIFASVFLFDTMYSKNKPPRDIVKELTEALIEKKKLNGQIKIVVILDPINKAYGNRIAPAVRRLVDNGVDVFYSDLISTKGSPFDLLEPVRDGLRVVDGLTGGALGKVLALITSPKIPIPSRLDPEGLSIEGFWNFIALQANHRKLLVTDSGDTLEALVSSANPHNASIPSTNFSVSVKGDLAKYIYMVLREDVKLSKELDYVLWANKSRQYRKQFLDRALPEIDPDSLHTGAKSASSPVGVCFMTESRIRRQVIEMLEDARPDDRIRIQMFYLSDFKVIDAIIETAKRLKQPMRIILDPNKDAFGKEKDGTPNRQVAAFLMRKKKALGLNLDIRWYDTHGEQNHAKIMSITSAGDEPKYELMNGSANWTGKNLKDINLEANIRVKGSKKIATQFNRLFDLFWENADGMVYTVEYHGKYEAHTGMKKWRNGENWGCVTW